MNLPDNNFQKIKEEYESIHAPKNLKKRIDTIMKKQPNNNSILRIAAKTAACVAAAAVVGIGALNLNPAFAASVSEIPGFGGLVRVLTFGKYEIKDGGFDALVETPKIEGLLDKELENELNTKFQENASAVIAAFEADMKEIKEAFPGEEVHMGMQSSYMVKTDNEDILAIDVYILNVVGSSSTKHTYYNINKKTGKLITLPEMFKENADYVGVLSTYIADQMQKINKESGAVVYWEADEFAESFTQISPDQKFYINDEGNIVICFDKYEVGPGSSGSPEFVIPNDIVADIILPL